MKKYLFLLATLLLTVSMSVSAQRNQRNTDNRGNMNNRRSEQMMRMTPQERVTLMTKELNLTTKEAAEVLALCEKQEAERKKQIEENRSQRNLSRQANVARREEMREKRLKEVEKQTAELEKIIGKERVQKWTDLRQDERDSNRAGRVDGRGNNRTIKGNVDNRQSFDSRRSDNRMRMSPKERVDLMTKELELTTQQAAQVLALTEKQEAERIAQVTENRKLRDSGSQNSEARRKEMREMREKQVKDHYAELEKIIGKEKLKKWNDLRQDVRDNNRAGRRNPSNRNR
jgi:DNA-binding CsgD family transcriptional regulator/L-rhamnose mutarotase